MISLPLGYYKLFCKDIKPWQEPGLISGERLWKYHLFLDIPISIDEYLVFIQYKSHN